MITSNRNVQVEFAGETVLNLIQKALANTSSPGTSEILTLPIGDNVITPPSVADIFPTALTIIMPAGNLIQVTLKGVAADDGILLHLTDPTSIGLSPDFVSLVLSVTEELIGLRLIWS